MPGPAHQRRQPRGARSRGQGLRAAGLIGGHDGVVVADYADVVADDTVATHGVGVVGVTAAKVNIFMELPRSMGGRGSEGSYG